MKNNMSTGDRVIRLLIAAVFATLYFTGIATGVLGAVLIIVAGIFVATSLTGFCPLYKLFGTGTKKTI